jgi:hypothetical protein
VTRGDGVTWLIGTPRHFRFIASSATTARFSDRNPRWNSWPAQHCGSRTKLKMLSKFRRVSGCLERLERCERKPSRMASPLDDAP